ncbi:MAG: NUDIX domain-containing protein [Bacteroidia bacterium]|nr:NUDIX domain-containing protein [Bacteroidia bacterium]MDW8133653.1 NUDIX domain-containing protein [Bacteroidia bacterium]
MLRVYHYEFCLELAVLPADVKGLPTTKVLPHERPPRMLYMPGTLAQIRSFHLSQGETGRPNLCKIFFPSLEAIYNFWEQYKQTFENVLAAGAVVVEKSDHILFIWRRGKWDLPKGKVEQHETPEETARRELAEETGISCAYPERLLTRTYHTYTEGEKQFLKEVRWFLFRCSETKPHVQVQKEEGIEGYRWVQASEVPFLYPQSYGTIRDVIEYVVKDVLSAPSA